MRTVCQFRAYEPTETKKKALAGQKVKGQFKNNLDAPVSTKKNDKKSLHCRYCKKPGHLIKDCRKLKKKNEKDGKTPESQQNPDTKIELKKENFDNSEDSQSSARVGYGHVATYCESSVCLNSSLMSQHVTATWIADSGASFHMTSHFDWIAGYQEFVDKVSVKLCDNRIVKAHGKGFIGTTTGVLDPVFDLPDISENLFSVASCAKKHKIFALSTDTRMIFTKNDHEVFRGELVRISALRSGPTSLREARPLTLMRVSRPGNTRI